MRYALALFLIACGGGQTLSLTFPDNRADDLRAVMTRLAASESSDAPVAIGISEDRLIAYDLRAQQRLWEQTIEAPQTAPYIAGELVILHEGARVVGRRMSDGGIAFAAGADNLLLVGAAGDGATAAFVLSTTGGAGARSRVHLVRGGGLGARFDFDSAVGVPDVRAGLVFVPWGNQNLTVIDAAQGAEIARLRYLDGVVGHARATNDGLYFGQRGVGRMSDTISPEAVGWFQPDTAGLPGRPELWRSAYEPPPGPSSAVHSIRIAWAPGSEVRPDLLYATFYKFVFGLSPEDLSVRWAYMHPADIVGAEAHRDGVVLADREGGLFALDASGRMQWSAELGAQVSAVALRIEGFSPTGAGGPELPSLPDQLLALVQSTDARLVPGRAFAARALAALEDPAVTEHIIVLCDDGSLPADVRRAACDALGNRQLGSDAILSALRRHHSFLEGTSAPPVGALATAAARANERRAVPLLVAHLRDPDTAAADLEPLATALGALGEGSAIDPLEDFLWLYHCDGDEEPFARALGAIARALVALAGPRGRETVQSVIDAPFTSTAARAQMTAAIAEPQRGE